MIQMKIIFSNLKMVEDMLISNESCKQINSLSMDKIEHLSNENMKLKYEIVDMKNANSELIHEIHTKHDEIHTLKTHHQTQINKRDDEIKQYKSNWLHLKSETDHDKKMEKELNQRKIQKLREDHFRIESELREDLEITRDELKELMHFRDMKNQANEKMQELEHMVQLLQERCIREKNEQEQKMLTERAKIHHTSEIKIAEIEKRARSKARHEFGAMVEQLVRDNKTVSNELRVQLQLLEKIQRERDQMKQDLKKSQRERSLQNEAEREYAKQVYELLKEKKYLIARAENLENELYKKKNECTKDKEEYQSELTKNIKKCQNENQNIKKKLDRKDRELIQIRQAAEEILNQRSNLEEFIVDCLIHTKNLIENERKNGNNVSAVKFLFHPADKCCKNVTTYLFLPYTLIQTLSTQLKNLFFGQKMVMDKNGTEYLGQTRKLEPLQLPLEIQKKILQLILSKIK